MNLVYRFWLCEANDGSHAAVYLYNTDECWIAVAPQLTEGRSMSPALATAYAAEKWIREGRKPHSSSSPESWLPYDSVFATPEETQRMDPTGLITRLLSNLIGNTGYRIKHG